MGVSKYFRKHSLFLLCVWWVWCTTCDLCVLVVAMMNMIHWQHRAKVLKCVRIINDNLVVAWYIWHHTPSIHNSFHFLLTPLYWNFLEGKVEVVQIFLLAEPLERVLSSFWLISDKTVYMWMIARRHFPSFMSWNASLISDSCMLWVMYSSILISWTQHNDFPTNHQSKFGTNSNNDWCISNTKSTSFNFDHQFPLFLSKTKQTFSPCLPPLPLSRLHRNRPQVSSISQGPITASHLHSSLLHSVAPHYASSFFISKRWLMMYYFLPLVQFMPPHLLHVLLHQLGHVGSTLVAAKGSALPHTTWNKEWRNDNDQHVLSTSREKKRP